MSGVHFLQNVSLFANLSRGDLEPLAHLLTTRKYRQAEPIFAQNSLGGSLYLVKAGRVGIVIHEQGQTQTIAEFGPGQAFGEFGLLDGLPRSAGAVALERCELLVLSRPDFFMYLEQHPAVALKLVIQLSRRLRFALQQTEGMTSEGTVLARLARLIADFGERYGVQDEDGVQLPIRLTQGELAGMLGCLRSEAEDALRALQDRGLITLRGLQLTIRDLDALRAVQAGPLATDDV